MNEIVKYDNYMNNLRFKDFTTTDFNFLMVLCNKLRDKDITEIIISFDELREKTGYSQHTIKQFISDLIRMNDKLMKMSCILEKDGTIFQFVLFPTFATDTINKRLIVAVNQRFKFILNDITKNFTRFELNEFIQLDSKYTKSLYRLLKQYRSTGRYEVDIEKFRKVMDIPKSYTNRDVMSKVINMSLNELDCYFQNLKCEPQYARKRGRPVTGYIFTFTPEVIDRKSDHGQDKKKGYDGGKKSTGSFSNFHQRTYDYQHFTTFLAFATFTFEFLKGFF